MRKNCLHMSMLYIFSELNRGDTNRAQHVWNTTLLMPGCWRRLRSWSWDLRTLPRLRRNTLTSRNLWRVPSCSATFANKCELWNTTHVPSGSRENTQNITNKSRTAVLPCFYRPKLTLCGTCCNMKFIYSKSPLEECIHRH